MYLSDWMQKYKEPRTEIKRIKNAYYKYEVAFVFFTEKIYPSVCNSKISCIFAARKIVFHDIVQYHNSIFIFCISTI